MSAFVLDASIALSWYFKDEHSELALAAFEASNSLRLLVPPHWYIEVANGMLVGERKNRMEPSDVGPFVSRLSDLMIDVDDSARTATMTRLLPLASHYQLTIYDALYLELAGRRSVPLATLDKKLAAAAQDAGVLLFEGAVE